MDKSEEFAIDPNAGRIVSTVARPEGFVRAPSRVVPARSLGADHADAALRSRPRGYWRFESTVEGAVPNEVAGRPPLRASGPIAFDRGDGGNGWARFRPGAPEQCLSTDALWPLSCDPGHAVELWFQADAIDYTSLVGLFPPREMNLPDNATRYLHTFLLELTAQKRRTLHKPASVRLLHRRPLDVRVEYNAYSQDYYVPKRWHHVVAQKRCGRLEVYFDGVLNRVQSIETDHPTVPCHLVVGRRDPDPKDIRDSRSFVGRLDELAVYDHPISDEEVRIHHGLARQNILTE